MITRIWHGTTRAADADAYLQYLRESGMKDYAATPGNRSARILRRIDGDTCHFYTVTEWEDEASIRRFAGPDLLKARYYDEDRRYLLAFEPEVQHFETFS